MYSRNEANQTKALDKEKKKKKMNRYMKAVLPYNCYS